MKHSSLKNPSSIIAICLFLSISFINHTLKSQIPNGKIVFNNDSSVSKKQMRKIADSLSLPYDYMHSLFRYQDPVLYLSLFPQFESIRTRSIPLRDGEGNNGYFLEGNIAHRITMYRGKYYSKKFFRKLRATFDAAFMLRLTQDTSSPMLPTGNDVGFGADYLLTNVEDLNLPGKTGLWIKAQLHHYSNGQAASFFLDGQPGRNNYKSGDFSTNYLRVMAFGFRQRVVGKWITHQYSVGLGIQREINFGGPLILSEELKSSYGLNRLLLNLQWVRAPVLEILQANKEQTFKNYKTQLSFRNELTYIIDKDLSLYPSSKKYRLSSHNYLTWMPWVTSDLGFVIHNYIGRDYLNIRYDDAVFTWQIGFVLNFNKV